MASTRAGTVEERLRRLKRGKNSNNARCLVCSVTQNTPCAKVRNLIPDIRKWLNTPEGKMNFYMTRNIMGHEQLEAYLNDFKTLFCSRETASTARKGKETKRLTLLISARL